MTQRPKDERDPVANILILEDDREFVELLVLDLQDLGHQVHVTESGADALERMGEEHFDLLIADIHIRKDGRPSRDGGLLLVGRLQALRISRHKDARADVPILVISGAISHPGQGNLLSIAKSMGADEVMAKPFSSYDLYEALARLLPRERPL